MSDEEHNSIIISNNDSISTNSSSDEKIKRYKHYLDADFEGHQVSMQTRRKLIRKRSSNFNSSSETIDHHSKLLMYIILNFLLMHNQVFKA